MKATGYADAKLIAACVRSTNGEIIAGYNGHTWGGYCELSHLWVDEQHRGQGLGSLLLRAAEQEALDGGCLQVVLATHDFQAPSFYERMGYQRKFVLEGRPKGHVDIVYAKVLRHEDRR